MFQFTGCPLLTLWIHVRIPAVFTGGFPHSEISGSQPVCGSPKLIAAYHVFHRLSVPRHPPCALLCLTFCTVHRMIQSSVVVHDYNCLSIFRSTTYHCFGKQQSHFCSDEQNRSCCFDVCLFLYSVFKVPKHVASNVLSGYLSTSRMETKRFELSTPCLQGRCSPN